jgi:hypothetical protein
LTKEEMAVLPVARHTGKAVSCIICQEDIAEQQEEIFLMCFHRFHGGCIEDWLTKNAKCPVCQYDLKAHIQGV